MLEFSFNLISVAKGRLDFSFHTIISWWRLATWYTCALYYRWIYLWPIGTRVPPMFTDTNNHFIHVTWSVHIHDLYTCMHNCIHEIYARDGPSRHTSIRTVTWITPTKPKWVPRLRSYSLARLGSTQLNSPTIPKWVHRLSLFSLARLNLTQPIMPKWVSQPSSYSLAKLSLAWRDSTWDDLSLPSNSIWSSLVFSLSSYNPDSLTFTCWIEIPKISCWNISKVYGYNTYVWNIC